MDSGPRVSPPCWHMELGTPPSPRTFFGPQVSPCCWHRLGDTHTALLDVLWSPSATSLLAQGWGHHEAPGHALVPKCHLPVVWGQGPAPVPWCHLAAGTGLGTPLSSRTFSGPQVSPPCWCGVREGLWSPSATSLPSQPWGQAPGQAPVPKCHFPAVAGLGTPPSARTSSCPQVSPPCWFGVRDELWSPSATSLPSQAWGQAPVPRCHPTPGWGHWW